jgi:hypothetical protein
LGVQLNEESIFNSTVLSCPRAILNVTIKCLPQSEKKTASGRCILTSNFLILSFGLPKFSFATNEALLYFSQSSAGGPKQRKF